MDLAKEHGKPMGSWFADYFAFSAGLSQLSATGYWAMVLGSVDCVEGTNNAWSDCGGCLEGRGCPVHQNHDYGYHPAGFAGVEGDEDAHA